MVADLEELVLSCNEDFEGIPVPTGQVYNRTFVAWPARYKCAGSALTSSCLHGTACVEEHPAESFHDNNIFFGDGTSEVKAPVCEGVDNIEMNSYFKMTLEHTYARADACPGRRCEIYVEAAARTPSTMNAEVVSETLYFRYATVIPDLANTANLGSPSVTIDPLQHVYKAADYADTYNNYAEHYYYDLDYIMGYTLWSDAVSFFVNAVDPDESDMTWSWTSQADSRLKYNGNTWSHKKMALNATTGEVSWNTAAGSVQVAEAGDLPSSAHKSTGGAACASGWAIGLGASYPNWCIAKNLHVKILHTT